MTSFTGSNTRRRRDAKDGGATGAWKLLANVRTVTDDRRDEASPCTVWNGPGTVRVRVGHEQARIADSIARWRKPDAAQHAPPDP